MARKTKSSIRTLLGGMISLLAASAAMASAQASATSAPASVAGPGSASAPYSPLVSFGTLPALQVSTPIPGSSHVPSDFNGDGTSDLLWFNPLKSQLGYWLMDAVVPDWSGGGVTRIGMHNYNITRGYFVGATGDFNGDGYADLMFTSAARDLWLWTNDRNGHFVSKRIGSYPDAWQLVGAGDINGDGFDDLLWENPSGCSFAYWLMKAGKRIGSKTIAIACGYYPMGIGYYAPTNRLSILWTSRAHDLYVWDSTGSDFKAYRLPIDLTYVWAFGGGYMGNGIGIETIDANETGYGAVYSRIFDARGNQTDFVGGGLWDGGIAAAPSAGGYVIQAKSTNSTGLYVLHQGNATIGTGGLAGSDQAFSGTAPIPDVQPSQWSYPVGWYVVGAPANGTAPLPWK